MDDIIAEIKQEPILKLNVSYGYKNYQDAIASMPATYKKPIYKTFIKIIIVILDIIMGMINIVAGISLIINSISPLKNVNNSTWISYFFTMFVIICGVVIWHSFNNPKLALSDISPKSFANYMNPFYKGRSVKEIKKIFIPCQYSFYDTCFFMSMPSSEDAKNCSAEKIKGLPLTTSNLKIEYESLNEVCDFNLNGLDEYCNYYPGIFIPEKQITEQEKGKLETIKVKIREVKDKLLRSAQKELFAIDNINKKDVDKEPILIVNLKCDYKDYIDLIELLPKKLNDSDYLNYLKIMSIITNVICIAAFIIELPNFLIHKYLFFLWILLICAVLQIFHFYFLYYYMQQKNPIAHIISKRVLPRWSTFYKGKSLKEIKTIIVPCRYDFYDTYFIKIGPSVEEAQGASAKEIVNLSLTTDSPKIEYKLLTNLNENKDCLSLCPGAFIPKRKLSEEEKVQLDAIKYKILLSL